MAEFPALPLWTDAWLADTHHLTRLERGTYLDLLILMWRSPKCRVPNDNKWLAKHLRISFEEVVLELRPIIRAFCLSTGNHLTQKRLLREFRYVSKLRHSQSVRAKSMWRNKKADAASYAPTPTPTPKESIDKKEKAHLKNGNGKADRSKPEHGRRTKTGRVWFDFGTLEFKAHAEDYRDAHFGDEPHLDWNGAGAWFNIVGEPR